jgi:hypothetical protein
VIYVEFERKLPPTRKPVTGHQRASFDAPKHSAPKHLDDFLQAIYHGISGRK